MKKVKLIGLALTLVLIMGCKMQATAGWAQVTAVLKADQKTVTSDYALFDAEEMFCCTQSTSAYPIKFESYGVNYLGGDDIQEQKISYNVGTSGSVIITANHNYHRIQLTGWNVDSAVKNCIGYGYITD